MNECEMISATAVNSLSITQLTPQKPIHSEKKSIEISGLKNNQEHLNNKTEIKNNFFIKNPRKSDYNLNILDSELVTFRKNFYHHVPKRRILQNTKPMENSSYHSLSQQQGQQQASNKILNSNNCIQKNTASPSTSSSLSTLQSQLQLQQNILANLSEVQTSTSNTKLRDKESERVVWEMWMRTPNTTPASTVLNSPDLTEIETSKNYQNQSHQIKVGRSPVSGHNDNGSPTTAQAQQNLAVVGDGEIVVFDDIEDNWQRQKNNALSSPASITDKQFEDFDLTNYRYTTDTPVESKNTSSSSKITKMIGGLPINDYEGSPRRFGSSFIQHGDSNDLAHQQPKLTAQCNLMPSPFFPPRPGFPQRVVSSPGLQAGGTGANTLELQNDDLSNKSTVNSGTDSIHLTQHTQATSISLENKPKESTFDYLYEFSETRKVLEEFFKCPNDEKKLSDFNESDGGSFLDLNQLDNNPIDNIYIGQRLAKIPKEEFSTLESPRPNGLYSNIQNENYDNNEIELYLDSGSRSSGELADIELEPNNRRHSRNFTLSPETTDYDSNCGDLDSSSNDVNGGLQDFVRLYTSMPVLEDGLSSGHASDTENNNPISIVVERKSYEIPNSNNRMASASSKLNSPIKLIPGMAQRNDNFMLKTINTTNNIIDNISYTSSIDNNSIDTCKIVNCKTENDCESIYSINNLAQTTPPPPAPVPHRTNNQTNNPDATNDVQAALRDIKTTLQRTQKITPTNDKHITSLHDALETSNSTSPIWIPRNEISISHESLDESIDNQSKIVSCDEEEADTDLETDRLLGQQRLDDQGFYEDKNWCEQSRKISNPRLLKSPTSSKSTTQNQVNFSNSTAARSSAGGSNGGMSNGSNLHEVTAATTVVTSALATTTSMAAATTTNEGNEIINDDLQKSPTESTKSKKDKNGKTRNKEGFHDPAVLIEGVLFRARYLGSTQLVCEGQPTKTTRMMQAEEAVSRIKAPEGESQPSTEVDLFISTEKIMVLNTDLKEIMMDHALRTISYIADIGDLVVLMARRRFVPSELDDAPKPNRTPKMICHVFESEEAQFIAQSIGQAFQVAYMEFLKANGIEDHSFVKEMDYQEVLNSQEIFGDELEIFAKKELQKEVVVPKAKGEILGVVIVESGWGSMLPTVVIANLLSTGAAARCGQLNIGDQIIAINGLSLVGLPLSTCQNYIRNTKNQTAVKFTVVPCPPVVEVKIKRPNTKYQLGFSVQNGVICSLLRGGIAERGGVRVGHRIIEINNQSVVAVPHEKIVNLLATSVGEILMKTMPTSMFRLLTGQENPIYI